MESTYFDTLGLTPHLGRTFSADETRAPGSAPLAVLGHGFWVRRFGENPAVLGRTVGLNGVAYTIVGVARRGFRGLTGEAELWVPITTLSAGDLGEAWNHSYQVVARRKADASVETVQAEAMAIGRRINELLPDPFPGDGGPGKGLWGATAVPLDDQRVDPLIRRSVLLLGAAVASVLLIVCVNLANLMLVRGLGREREVAIRLALGASRLRIVRQLMTESLVLAIAGTLIGLAVAYAAVSAGASLAPDLRMVLPRGGPEGGLTRVGFGLVGFDSTVLLFTVGMAIATAVLFGLGPAWRASRRDLTASMKIGSSGSVASGARGLALRNLLIVGEIALALVLLTAGGLMLKSVVRLQATEVGFNPDGLLTVRVTLPGPQYNGPRATQFLADLVERLEGHANIDAVAYGSCAPVSGGCNGTLATFPGRPPAPPGRGPVVGVLWASPRYFDTLGIRVIRGRAFTEGDRAGQPKVVVISEAAARAFWGSGDPIGQRIGLDRAGSRTARRSSASPPTSATVRSRRPCARTSTCRSCSPGEPPASSSSGAGPRPRRWSRPCGATSRRSIPISRSPTSRRWTSVSMRRRGAPARARGCWACSRRWRRRSPRWGSTRSCRRRWSSAGASSACA